jgi:hypothetical protein
VALVLGVSMVPTSAWAADRPTCAGRTATIWGTPGDDLLVGTDGPDVFVGRGGDDIIRAGGGDDVVCAGGGADDVEGGGGDDLMIGGSGVDRLVGGPGRDRAEGGTGIDDCLRHRSLFGGPVTGTYGSTTASAVVAFHKVIGTERSESWRGSDWARLAAFAPEAPTRRRREPDRIEIDIGHQVLFLIEGGEVTAIAPVSTGGGYTYVSDRTGRPTVARTPRGDFTLRWFDRGWGCDPVTGWCVYDYWSFSTYYGIHGYHVVPTHPASHGCVRLNVWDSDRLTPHFFVGMPVHIWDTPP